MSELAARCELAVFASTIAALRDEDATDGLLPELARRFVTRETGWQEAVDLWFEISARQSARWVELLAAALDRTPADVVDEVQFSLLESVTPAI